MALTRDFKETVMARARRDPEFRGALLIGKHEGDRHLRSQSHADKGSWCK